MKVKTQLNAPLVLMVALLALSFCFQACDTKTIKGTATEVNTEQVALKAALTFYSSFDQGINADFALGDDQLYTSPIKSMDSARVGLHKSDISIADGKGLFGNGLQFTERSAGYIFYRSESTTICS